MGGISAWTPSSSPSVGLAITQGDLSQHEGSSWVWIYQVPPTVSCSPPTSDTWNSYSQALHGSGRTLLPIETNLVDQAWGDQRPPPPSGEIYSLPAAFTGTTTVVSEAAVQMLTHSSPQPGDPWWSLS